MSRLLLYALGIVLLGFVLPAPDREGGGRPPKAAAACSPDDR
jgi:hypothetical protein